MRRVSFWLSLACLLGGIPSSGWTQPAYETEYSSETPLIVIRFNQRRVPFEHSLYNVMTRALQVKPGVVFDVVAVTPDTADSALLEQYTATTHQHAEAVIAAMQHMGMPANRIALTESKDRVASSEVRVFVR